MICRVVFKPEAYVIRQLEDKVYPFFDQPFNSIEDYEQNCHVKVGERLTEMLYVTLNAEHLNKTSEDYLNDTDVCRNGFYIDELYANVLDTQKDVHVMGRFWEAIIKDTDIKVTETCGTEFDDLIGQFD